VARRRGRRRKKLLDDLKDRREYSHLKEAALDLTMWRHRFGGGFGPVVRQNTGWMNEWKDNSLWTQLCAHAHSRAHAQHNSFNWHSFIQNCWKSGMWGEWSRRKEVLLLTMRKLTTVTQADLKDMFKWPPRVSVHQLLWYPRTPCLLLHQHLQLWRLKMTQKRTLMTLNQQLKEISKWNTPLISLAAQV